MTQHTPSLTRRTALQTASGAVLTSVAGCLNSGDDNPSDATSRASTRNGVIERVAVEKTTLILGLSADEEIDQINLIQPDGELFGQKEPAEGSGQVSFDIGTSYDPGEYTIIALRGEEAISEISELIQPQFRIRDVGLYRNNPDKPWDEVYGESETNRKKNGEAFVTVENTGSGPDAAIKLRFSGDVPNPIEDPRGNGVYETEQVFLGPNETTDLFSSSFPFGAAIGDGMGCSSSGNSGEFSVIIETEVANNEVSKTYDVQYSGSDEMTDCEVTIMEA